MSAELDTPFTVESKPPAAEEEEVPAMTERANSETDRLIGVTNGVSSPPDSGEEGSTTSTDPPLSKTEKWRNIVGFWILGLCNNYPYVVMLSAAFDILATLENNDGDDSEGNSERDCHKQSTAVILLADILPTFIIKLTLPYVMNFIPYWIRVWLVVFFLAISFVVVGLNGLAFNSEPLVILGVVCASIGAGFGEITFLSLSARYDKSTVSGWSSGTGAAGVAGALIYLILRIGLSPQVSLLIQTFTPVLMLISYLFILGKPGKILPQTSQGGSGTPDDDIDDKRADLTTRNKTDDDKSSLLETDTLHATNRHKRRIKLKFFNREELAYWWSHVKYIPHLFKYMVPLFLVYVAEYMINQGLFELFLYDHTHLGSVHINRATQYRILQVVYQVGVLISRSSLIVVHIRPFWILALLQVVNFIFLFYEAVYLFIPSFWITFVLVLYEGLLGGGVYVNAFYTISREVPKIHREFSMGVASVADSTGITVAAVASIYIHKYVCGLPT